MAARKAWRDYSPSYRHRLERHGITEKNYRTATRSKARGHSTTPEHPKQGVIHREKYQKYFMTRQELIKATQEKKNDLFGDVHKYNRKRSDMAVEDLKRPARMRNMRIFLDAGMDTFDRDDFDWSDAAWAFLHYH